MSCEVQPLPLAFQASMFPMSFFYPWVTSGEDEANTPILLEEVQSPEVRTSSWKRWDGSSQGDPHLEETCWDCAISFQQT